MADFDQQNDQSGALSLIDPADPSSLVNVLPYELSELLKALPTELLIQDEETLETLVSPSRQQKRLKIQFWNEFEQALHQKRPMVTKYMHFGVCTKEYFNDFILTKKNLAWLVTPRATYDVRVAELMDQSLHKLQALLDALPTPDPGAKNFSTMANLTIQLHKMIDMRQHGAYTQKIEQKSLNMNINRDASGQSEKGLDDMTPDQLKGKLEELNEKLRTGQNQNGALLSPSVTSMTDVIEVEPRMVDGREDETSSGS